MNEKKSDEWTKELEVIKKYYDKIGLIYEYEIWYQDALKDELKYFDEKVGEKYKFVMEQHAGNPLL